MESIKNKNLSFDAKLSILLGKYTSQEGQTLPPPKPNEINEY
jgi:hypothetical protein